MTLQLQTVIEAVRALPLSDKLEVLDAISEDLNWLHSFEKSSTAFWMPKSIVELTVAQPAPIVTDVRSLVAGFWPEDESADDVNQFISEQRHVDRSRDE